MSAYMMLETPSKVIMKLLSDILLSGQSLTVLCLIRLVRVERDKNTFDILDMILFSMMTVVLFCILTSLQNPTEIKGGGALALDGHSLDPPMTGV